MRSFLWYSLAAAGEIAGCFSFWAWLRFSRSPLWTIPGVVSLVMFALALTRIETPFAGRAYAAYGGIYIVSSLLWLWVVEKTRPTNGTRSAPEFVLWEPPSFSLVPVVLKSADFELPDRRAR